MSFSAEISSSSRISGRLIASSIRDLSSLILRTEDGLLASPEVLPPLLELLVGGPFDKENCDICEPNIILLLFELLPHFTEPLQLEVWSTLGLIFHHSLSNIHACRQLRLIERCLEHLHKTPSDRVANHVVKVLEIVGSYNISLNELQDILSYLYTGHKETWAPHSTVLFDGIRNLSVNKGPDVFFSFSGAPGAALTLPPLTKWPTQSGFTFNTWIRLEGTRREHYRPSIYWFRTGHPELGYSAHLIGSTLVIETMSRGKKPQTHKVNFAFKSYHWYMLTVVYIHNRMKNSQLLCYVDSRLVLSAVISLPSTDTVFDKCFLGSTPASTADVVFRGQMAAVYLFKEPLGKEVVRALFKLGPGYKSQFNFDAESDVPLLSGEKKVLFDGRLSSSVVFSYNAKAVDGQLCLEASPNENQSYFAHSPHATLLEGVSPIKTTIFHNILHSLGGVQVLLPILSQLDVPQDPFKVDYNLSVKFLSLVFKMALTSSSFLFQLVQINAFDLVAYFLERASPDHLSTELLICIFNFAISLMETPNGNELLCQVIETLLFNPALWIRAHEKVQIQLYSRLAAEFTSGDTVLYLRNLVDIEQLLFVLREYYSLVAEEGERSETHCHVRPYLLLIMKAYLTKGRGMEREDMRALLDYLCSVPNEENLRDVLNLMLALVFEDDHHPGNTVTLFYDEGGIDVAAKLIAFTSEEVTLNSLKLVGMVLHHSPTKVVQHLINTVELLAVLREKLLSAGQPVTIPMFNTLYEVLVDSPTRKIIDRHYIALNPSHEIKYHGMLSVMIELVCSLDTSLEEREYSDVAMRIQLFSCVLSLCIQNSQNCKAVLRLHHWQHWFLMLADHPRAKESDQASLQEMAYKLFHVILLCGFREELDGWSIWLDTAAAIHSYVTCKTEEEDYNELFSDSPTDIHSDSPVSDPDSHSTLTLASDDPVQVEAADPTNDELSSSAVNLIDDLQDSSASHNGSKETSASHDGSKETIPSSSHIPLAQEHGKLPDNLSPAVITRTRSISSEGPPSPLFIPKNPFLELAGKMPKFKWTSSHLLLLEELLVSLQEIVEKWKKSPEKQKDSLGHSSNKYLRSNIVHLLCLVADNIISLNGGLRHLLAHSSSPNLVANRKQSSLVQSGSKHPSLSLDPGKVQYILELIMELEEVMVRSGLLKLSPVETKLKMEQGGCVRQGLRLVLASESLSTIKANIKNKNYHIHYYKEKQSARLVHKDSIVVLQSLNLRESSLMNYFQANCEQRLQNLNKCQQLLSTATIAHLRSLIPNEKDNRVLLNQIVISIVYYLSTMCVAKYRHILAAHNHKEEKGGENYPSCETKSERDINLVSSEGSRTVTSQESNCHGDLIPAHDMYSISQDSVQGEGVEDSFVPSCSSTQSDSLDISEQVEASMELVGPFLCELLLEHKLILSKMLVGANGRVLITDAVLRLARSRSTVEMTMLLCSQEWQNALQKNGGKVFSNLLAEGKRMTKFSDNYIQTVASRTTSSLEQTLNVQTEKFTDFEERLSLSVGVTIKTTNEKLKLKRADINRHTAAAKELWRTISSVVNDKGVFDFTPLKDITFWRLDLRENSSRQHLQLLPNSNGSTHEEAVRSTDLNQDTSASEEEVKNKISLPSLTSPQGSHLDPDEDIITSDDLMENLVHSDELATQLFSVQCMKVLLSHAIPGTLVLSESSIAFTADDSTSEYQRAQWMEGYCTLNDRKLLADVTAILSRSYLHQSNALEIFFTDKTSAFLVFENRKEVGDVVRRLPKVGAGPQFDLPQTRSTTLASPSQLFKKSSMTSKWERREISNFEYLMHLNTIAGRSYNDLNQYPVFPWILRDYSSKRLNLSDPNMFRDLSKPMGALNPSRLEQFEERYNSFEDETLPPFYYGTHYSTMAFVLHWLLRVEPFSTLHINFHDGVFDHSSRLFVSLQESWQNSTLDTSDVNELIPEFFYLPEMFQNDNKFNFGRSGPCADGDIISNVRLPPWASSVHEFIHMHREALESEHVSLNLHHWIDLIFGYKQRGTEAVMAKNVFYYLTYAGSIDLDTIKDPMLRKGLEDQIRSFGQTPAQLLNEPHPSRQELRQSLAPQPVQGLNPKDVALLAELQVTPDIPIALACLSVSKNDLLVVSCNQLYAVNKWIINAGSSKNHAPTVAIEPDKQIASGLRTRLGDPLDQSVMSPSACFTTLPSCNVIIVCGFWDNSFKCFDTNSGAMLQSVFGHRHIVSCIDYSSEEGLHAHTGAGLIGTGSHDATVLLWRWSGRHNKVVRSLSQSQEDTLTPLSVCTGHRQPVVCLSLSSSLGIVVSGAKYGTTLVHATMSGELLHNVSPSPHLHHPHLLKITRNGHFVVHYADQKGCLAVYTCNGKLLSQLPLQGPALALTVSEDGRFLVSGGFDCTVRIFTTYNLQPHYTHPPFDSRIRSLHISKDQRYVIAGLASGTVCVLSTHVWINSH